MALCEWVVVVSMDSREGQSLEPSCPGRWQRERENVSVQGLEVVAEG